MFTLFWVIFVMVMKQKKSQMETMGMDACMMIGYHNKVSKIVANQSFYSNNGSHPLHRVLALLNNDIGINFEERSINHKHYKMHTV